MSDRETVALLGVGTMGAGMARNLAASGFSLRLWNRSPCKAEALQSDTVTAAENPAAAVAGAGIVITMLWDADSVADVIGEAAPGLAAGTIWIQTSTVGIDGTARLADLAAKHGVILVDAPVLGTRKPAEDGTLVVLASGPDDVHDRCAPVFDAIGSRTVWLGPAGQGSRVKLVANAWVLVVLDGVAECLTLANALGLDPALFFEAIRGGAMDAPYVGLKGRAMLAGDFTPSFSLAGAAKDADLILAAADAAGADVGVLERIGEYFGQAVDAGYGDLDMSAVYLAHQADPVD
ncbi:MAG TPA: NAD(P)-dependent oxidoreductase [Kineosporiaceae bacterium]|nr:NAD(P)-dependent oxidoreductase [Kineosporiaceae bacterium]